MCATMNQTLDSNDRQETLVPGSHSFVVFIDETGDEKFGQPIRPVFGFGGCAVLGADLDRFIHVPWRTVRHAINGSPDAPLHAADLPRPVKDDHMLSLGIFFASVPFSRFGVTCDRDTTLPLEFGRVHLVLEVLKERINAVLRYTWATDVIVIFEHTERLEKVIAAHFGDYSPHQFGRVLSCNFYFMPKSANDPGLEVADFVVNACGTQAALFARRADALSFGLDFQAVFHSADVYLNSYIHINHMTVRNPQPPRDTASVAERWYISAAGQHHTRAWDHPVRVEPSIRSKILS